MPAAYRTAPANSTRSCLTVSSAKPSAISGSGQKAENTNGSLPPSGKAIAIRPTGTSAPATTALPRSAARSCRRSARPPIAVAAPARPANSAATGLQSAVSTANNAAAPALPRCSASTLATAGSSPNANVRRPV